MYMHSTCVYYNYYKFGLCFRQVCIGLPVELLFLQTSFLSCGSLYQSLVMTGYRDLGLRASGI